MSMKNKTIFYLILIFEILVTKLFASRLCIYKYDSDNYPNYCSESIEFCDNSREFTINNITKLCDLYGYQNLGDINSCESYRNKEQERSLYCVYKCNQTHYPNYCVSSGDVCPRFSPIEQCSLFQVPKWFDTIDLCNTHQNNTSPTTFEEESIIMASYNKTINELGPVKFGIRTKEIWNSGTRHPVTLSLIWGHTMYQCTVFAFEAGKDYICHTLRTYETHSCDSPLDKSWYGLQISLGGDDGVGIDKVTIEIENKNVSLEVDYFCFNATNNVRNELNSYVSSKCSNYAGFDAISIDSTIGDKYLIFVRNVLINLNVTPAEIESKEAHIIAHNMDQTINCFPEHEAKYILVDAIYASWYEAQEYCKNVHNSSLATIVTQEDFMEVIALKEQKFEYTYSYFWTGMNDLDNEGVWTWADRTSCGYAKEGLCKNDIHWLENQPDNHDPSSGGEHCAAFYALDGYNDYTCDKQLHFFCNNKDYTRMHKTTSISKSTSWLEFPLVVIGPISLIIILGFCVLFYKYCASTKNIDHKLLPSSAPSSPTKPVVSGEGAVDNSDGEQKFGIQLGMIDETKSQEIVNNYTVEQISRAVQKVMCGQIEYSSENKSSSGTTKSSSSSTEVSIGAGTTSHDHLPSNKQDINKIMKYNQTSTIENTREECVKLQVSNDQMDDSNVVTRTDLDNVSKQKSCCVVL